MSDLRKCQCLPFAEHFRRSMHSESVPRCELHGTLGQAGQAGTQAPGAAPLPLNSEALENRLADSLNAAVDKGHGVMHDDQSNF